MLSKWAQLYQPTRTLARIHFLEFLFLKSHFFPGHSAASVWIQLSSATNNSAKQCFYSEKTVFLLNK